MVQLSINANNTIRHKAINKPSDLEFFIVQPPLSGADVLHFDVDALPFTQMFPTYLFRLGLDGDKAFGVVYAWIVSERIDPKLVMKFEQCLFHRSSLQYKLSI